MSAAGESSRTASVSGAGAGVGAAAAAAAPPPGLERVGTLETLKHRISASRSDRVEAKYDVVMEFPNLELHSAAAAGNVGLVHYALTHGQPVNSVMHGVLPIHAACSGGNMSVVRMLIENGADVNAPRLPRRYSDGRKPGAPAVGTAGSTPLHFAAANGHANVVQVLLTCGANPDKPDKNGMTPEDLADMSGHGDVLHTLRAWEHLKLVESQSAEASPVPTTATEPSATEAAAVSRNGSLRSSRKGKERAGSVVSAHSITDKLAALKTTLETSLHARPSFGSDASASSSATPAPFFDASSASGTPLSSPLVASNPASPITGHSLELARTETGASAGSSVGNLDELAAVPSPTLHHAKSSRRPSLPSILEKATHPGAAFRAAMRRDRPTLSAETSPRQPSQATAAGHLHSPFFRGRGRTAEQTPMSAPPTHASRRYSKQSLLHLFKRGQSPPSRSPSPPMRNEAQRVIGSNELDEGLERLKRASMDLDRRDRGIDLDQTMNGSVIDLGDDADDADQIAALPVAAVLTTTSAPATRSRFFEDFSTPLARLSGSSAGSAAASVSAASTTTSASGASDRTERPPRSRTGSGVVSPSPLAREWADSASSDDEQRPALQRANTQGAAQGTDRATVVRRTPSLPTTAKPVGLGPWVDDVDLRKVASSVLLRENEKKREGAQQLRETQGEEEDEDEDEEDDFHDALVEEPQSLEQQVAVIEPVVALPLNSVSGRLRGASIGSMTTDSTRLSTPPGSHRSVAAHEESERVFDPRGPGLGMPPLRPLSAAYDTRPRGKSTSSVASSASGVYPLVLASTSVTSLTPPSMMSVALGSAFPPVPENEVARATSPPIRHPSTRRVSSRTEARDQLEQNERDIMQLAQLPASADSSRSLSAQLAAYGENHALEQEFARIERLTSRDGQDEAASSAVSGDSASFITAHSGDSLQPSDGSRRRSQKPRALSTPAPADAPPAAVPALNGIYDRRAAAYRERLAALTSAPPVFPSARAGPFAPLPAGSTPFDAWTRAGGARSASDPVVAGAGTGVPEPAPPPDDVDRHPHISSPMPVVSPERVSPRRLSRAGVARSAASQLGSSLKARSSSLSGSLPAHLQTPAAALYPRAAGAEPAYQGAAGTPRSPARAASLGPTYDMSAPPLGAPASASRASWAGKYAHHLAHSQGDGDDSDDDADTRAAPAARRRYTVIENDWRGGHVVEPVLPVRKKTGLRGVVGHLRR